MKHSKRRKIINGNREVIANTTIEPGQIPNSLYDHGVTAEMFHPDSSLDTTGLKTSIGLDLKKTPNGEWELIEINPDMFGAEDFDTLYAFGSIIEELPGYSHSENASERDMVRNVTNTNPILANSIGNSLDNSLDNKQFATTYLPSLQEPRTLDDFEPLDENNIIYLKNPHSAQGKGVKVFSTRELEERSHENLMENLNIESPEEVLVEDRVPSEGKKIDGRNYDSCMRYVISFNPQHDLDELGSMGVEPSSLLESESYGGLTVKFHGGYWRTAEKPMEDSSASLKQRFVASHDRGEPVPADFKELREATEKSLSVAKEIYSLLLYESDNREYSSEHMKEYGDEIQTEWEEEFMEWEL